MITGIYILTVLLFSLAFYFTRLVQTCSQVLTIARQATHTISNSNLDDYAKEKAIQQAALLMLKNCVLLVIKGAVIFAAAVLPLWLADVAGLAEFDDTSQFALRWDVLLVTTIVIVAAMLIWRRLYRSKHSDG